MLYLNNLYLNIRYKFVTLSVFNEFIQSYLSNTHLFNDSRKLYTNENGNNKVVLYYLWE